MSDDAREPSRPGRGPGMLVVYTGDGKGKTTAALGLAARAVGRGLSVGVMQFIKGKWSTGERTFFVGLDGVEFLVMGLGFTWDSDDISRDSAAARAAWETSSAWIREGAHDVVVLDELTYAINYGFLDEESVRRVLLDRADEVDVVVTGRSAPASLIEAADLVTEMRAVKHPFVEGRRARPGIDY
ncbi:MAG: cob(I)yrinic acid a,c-diamide adenosyltransferase [Planctomycetota bacterium]